MHLHIYRIEITIVYDHKLKLKIGTNFNIGRAKHLRLCLQWHIEHYKSRQIQNMWLTCWCFDAISSSKRVSGLHSFQPSDSASFSTGHAYSSKSSSDTVAIKFPIP